MKLPQVCVQDFEILLLLVKPLQGAKRDIKTLCDRIVNQIIMAFLTLSVSAFLPAIFEMDSPTFFISRMKPAPLKAAVSLDLGSYREREGVRAGGREGGRGMKGGREGIK